MSDLYQMVKLAKSGDIERTELIRERVEALERQRRGPICCFFTSQKKDVLNDKHLDLSDFMMPECSDDEVVIGCSRGCVPLSEARSTYSPKLCEPCVAEARKYLEST